MQHTHHPHWAKSQLTVHCERGCLLDPLMDKSFPRSVPGGCHGTGGWPGAPRIHQSCLSKMGVQALSRWLSQSRLLPSPPQAANGVLSAQGLGTSAPITYLCFGEGLLGATALHRKEEQTLTKHLLSSFLGSSRWALCALTGRGNQSQNGWLCTEGTPEPASEPRRAARGQKHPRSALGV